MAHYLVQVGYASEVVAAMFASPQGRMEAVGPPIENPGESVADGRVAFGE